jgi:hypothetical protein
MNDSDTSGTAGLSGPKAGLGLAFGWQRARLMVPCKAFKFSCKFASFLIFFPVFDSEFEIFASKLAKLAKSAFGSYSWGFAEAIPDSLNSKNA